jgi:DNA-binding MarR family transcriptional regulator
MDDSSDYSPAQTMPIPALLRAARGTYGIAIRGRLAQAGFDDVPANGPFILGGMANQGETAANLLRGLNVSKQAASQLVDTLVVRGYLDRAVDSEDRRRNALALTERGTAAAHVARDAIVEVDEALAAHLSSAEIATLRKGLFSLWLVRTAVDPARSSD